MENLCGTKCETGHTWFVEMLFHDSVRVVVLHYDFIVCNFQKFNSMLENNNLLYVGADILNKGNEVQVLFLCLMTLNSNNCLNKQC